MARVDAVVSPRRLALRFLTPSLAVWLLLLFAFITIGGGPDHAAQRAPAPGTTPDADQLFAKIYPVFTHDRCAKCHGVVQPYPGVINSVTGATHPGGEVVDDPRAPTAVTCYQCHDETEEWQHTAPPMNEWVGMSQEQLCTMQAAEVRLRNHAAGGAGADRPKSYLNHLKTDELIAAAFKGRAGGARNGKDPDLDVPLLSFADFIKGATEWVNAGAPCRAVGTISQVEEQEATYSIQSTSGGRISFKQSARRTVNIARYADGSATATVTASGSDDTIQTLDAGGCQIVTSTRNVWGRTGPAQVAAKVEIEVKPAEYTIHFVLPAETTTTSTSTSETNTCGARNITDPPSRIEQTWRPFAMTLHCPTMFPNHDGSLGCVGSELHDTGATNGTLHRTVKDGSDGADPASWLYRSPMATARIDTGEGLPVHVTVNYAVRLNQR